MWGGDNVRVKQTGLGIKRTHRNEQEALVVPAWCRHHPSGDRQQENQTHFEVRFHIITTTKKNIHNYNNFWPSEGKLKKPNAFSLISVVKRSSDTNKYAAAGCALLREIQLPGRFIPKCKKKIQNSDIISIYVSTRRSFETKHAGTNEACSGPNVCHRHHQCNRQKKICTRCSHRAPNHWVFCQRQQVLETLFFLSSLIDKKNPKTKHTNISMRPLWFGGMLHPSSISIAALRPHPPAECAHPI